MTPLEWFRDALPLKVDLVFVTDPVITFSGDGWLFTAMCPWSLVGPNVEITWEAEEIEEGVRLLQGRSIVAVSALDSNATDPVLYFDGGFRLSVTADTDFDPWSLDLIPRFSIVGRMAR